MPPLIFFRAAFGESRDSGSLRGLGLYARCRYAADTFARLLNEAPDIWTAADGDPLPAYPIDDALALCALTFKGGIGWFAGLNLYDLNRWTEKAAEIIRARQEAAAT
ncbi:TPA: hypothetical protein ACFN66_001400 [Neisseria meningitidis]